MSYLSDQPARDEKDPGIRLNPVKKHPQKVLVVGVIGSDGQKCLTIFVDADEKIDRLVCSKLLDRRVIPWVKVIYPEGKFVFQQDNAPTHNAAAVQAKLARNLGRPDHVW